MSLLRMQTEHLPLPLYVLFFCSGITALIYQIMWQRMLFIVFGIDLVSITIVVSVFMFGLGMGGLLGGWLADRLTHALLALYVIIEFGIAVFGFLSPTLIDLTDKLLFTSNQFITSIVCYLLLAIPTLLMGATFPILVVHTNRSLQNIGESVGGLYFSNTLGAACGAYLSGFVLLAIMDANNAVMLAAAINLAIACAALLLLRGNK